MNDIVWAGIGIALNMAAPILIIFRAFRTRLNKAAFAVCAAFVLLGAAAYCLFPAEYRTFRFYWVWKLTLIAPGVLLAFPLIGGDRRELPYFLSKITALTAAAVGTGDFIALNLMENAGYFELAAAYAAVHIVTVPPMMLYIHKFAGETLGASAPGDNTWRVAWTIPAFFLLGNAVAGHAPGAAALFVNIVSAAGVFAASEVLRGAARAEARTTLRWANEQAAESAMLGKLEQMKAEITQNLNHELKTPLTVISSNISNAADQLDFKIDIDDIRESLGSAQREIMRMARMINGAMEHPAAGSARRDTERIDIAAFLREGAETYRAMLERRGNALAVDTPAALPPVSGSVDTLLLVLSNLLANANRHTRNGQITVHAAAKRDTVVITVRDNGEGVKPEILPRIFDRGVSDGGTGLGLSICKSAVEAHGGTITVESEYGSGAAVIVTLPVCSDAKPPE